MADLRRRTSPPLHLAGRHSPSRDREGNRDRDRDRDRRHIAHSSRRDEKDHRDRDHDRDRARDRDHEREEYRSRDRRGIDNARRDRDRFRGGDYYRTDRDERRRNDDKREVRPANSTVKKISELKLSTHPLDSKGSSGKRPLIDNKNGEDNDDSIFIELSKKPRVSTPQPKITFKPLRNISISSDLPSPRMSLHGVTPVEGAPMSPGSSVEMPSPKGGFAARKSPELASPVLSDTGVLPSSESSARGDNDDKNSQNEASASSEAFVISDTTTEKVPIADTDYSLGYPDVAESEEKAQLEVINEIIATETKPSENIDPEYTREMDREDEEEHRMRLLESRVEKQTELPIIEEPDECDDEDDEDDEDDDMFAERTGDKKKTSKRSIPVLVQAGNAGEAALQSNWDDEEGYYRIIIGEIFEGRYHIQANLGKGMFACVVKAHDKIENRSVAIKIIRNNDIM